IRRKPLIENEIVQFGSLSFDRVGRKLSVKGVDLDLPRRELAVFECLFERQNQIVSKTKIADHIYGVGADIEERVVEIYLSRLRKKLIAHGVVIKVARGLGYMMRVKE
ncbi:winged helix-turn-helix domain-containing protein, partial [Amylibacter sp.]|nr:winged helix-turn-helix domain-containing protein [Amylibacter sp.]